MWPFRRSGKRATPDPTQNHAFVETNDAGIGAAASGSSLGSTFNRLGMTTAFLRSTRCAVPGCNKERHDPIHAAAED